MTVVGVYVHKHSLTAIAVDELGRTRAARSGPVDVEILEWAYTLDPERLWALEETDLRKQQAARGPSG